VGCSFGASAFNLPRFILTREFGIGIESSRFIEFFETAWRSLSCRVGTNRSFAIFEIDSHLGLRCVIQVPGSASSVGILIANWQFSPLMSSPILASELEPETESSSSNLGKTMSAEFSSPYWSAMRKAAGDMTFGTLKIPWGVSWLVNETISTGLISSFGFS